MAEHVLTTGSIVTCIHAFPITFTPTATLRVGGQLVVRSPDIASAKLGCTASSKCEEIAQSSLSEILRDGGEAVVLATGLATNNGSCTVVAAHDLLRTD